MKLDVKVEDRGMVYDLTNFPKKAEKVIRSAGRKAGREGRDGVKDRSPVKYGDYRKGWSFREKTGVGGSFEGVIHNRTHWSLTHLLEDGHWIIYMGRPLHRETGQYPHFSNYVREIGDNFVKYCDLYLDSLD